MRCFILLALLALTAFAVPRWSAEKAKEWFAKHPFRAGSNYLPATCQNEICQWQAETFDPAIIDRELGYAEELGYNLIRVFLHNIPWVTDSAAFLKRIDTFLSIADKHGVKVLLVMFDDCWKDDPHAGPQPEPINGVHNSQWVQCPGRTRSDRSTWPALEQYVKGVMNAFKDDDRVAFWDIYNEPNTHHVDFADSLLSEAFKWAREVNLTQPISACQWDFNDATKNVNIWLNEQSDIVTFHWYGDIKSTTDVIQQLKDRADGRPIICTEYMARRIDSTIMHTLPLLKENNIWAVQWGLCEGKMQTWQSWGSPEGTPMPELWFHDLLWRNGTARYPAEAVVIKKVMGKTDSFATE